MNILPGDLLFVWGRGLVPLAIEACTHDGPSHVAIFVDEATVCEAQRGRLFGESSLSSYLQGKVHLEVWGDLTLTDPERQQMIDYAKTLYQTPYDDLLVLLEGLHLKLGLPIGWYHEHGHLICCSAAYTIGSHVGKRWAEGPNCTPGGMIDFGVLQKKMDLTLSGSAAS